MVIETTKSKTLNKGGVATFLEVLARKHRFLEENIKVSLYDLRLGKVFLAMTPKEQTTKGKK